jgi:hypothetical protein
MVPIGLMVAESYPPELPGWVILRTPGRSDAPDTPAWRKLVHEVEEVATAALLVAGAPF